MTDEIKNEDVQGEPEVNQVETAARTKGWRPKDEWEGPEENWVDAEEFVKRQPLFDKIESLKSELWRTQNQHKQEITLIKDQFTKMHENAYKEALKELKEQRAQALVERDAEAVVKIEEQIDELKDEIAEKKAQSTTPQRQAPDPAYVAWIERNGWYAQDRDLRADADGFGVAYMSNHPTASVAEVLQHVDKKMAQLYPEKFGKKETQRTNTPTVESSTNRAPRGKAKMSVSDLSEQDRRIYDTLVNKHKVVSAEEFFAQYSN